MADKEILIHKGSTLVVDVYWEDRDTILRKPITGISLAFGAPRLECIGHNIPNNWRGFITQVGGMRQINSENNPPSGKDWHVITVLDADHIELNGVIPVDDNGREWSAYTSGGFINLYAPQDLTGQTARMDMKDRIGGTTLLSSELSDSPLDKIALYVDAANYKTTMTIEAVDTAAIAFKKAVTELEMVKSTGFVTKLKLTDTPDDEPDPVRVVGEATT